MADYPEHEKLKKVSETSNRIGEFLEWLLSEQDYVLATWVENKRTGNEKLQIAHRRIEDLLADFFEIDLKKLEAEKQQMLDEIRASHTR